MNFNVLFAIPNARAFLIFAWSKNADKDAYEQCDGYLNAPALKNGLDVGRNILK